MASVGGMATASLLTAGLLAFDTGFLAMLRASGSLQGCRMPAVGVWVLCVCHVKRLNRNALSMT